MENRSNRFLITCGIALLVACLCLSVIAVGGTGVYFLERGQPTQAAQVQPTPAPEMRAPTPTACSGSACPTPAGSQLPASVLRQIDTIEQQVEDIRGLKPSMQIPLTLLTPEQLRERVMNDFLKDYTAEDARKDAAELAALHLLPEGYDLMKLYEDLYSEQIAGFFDNKTKEMVVIQGEAFGGPERMTFSHEYTHFLQDQNYDFKNWLKWDDETCKQDSERCAAIQSLIEGDATLTEQLWFIQHATAKDQSDVQDFAQNLKMPVYDSAPAFLKEDFMFPYSQGLEFVQTLYGEGGFAAIDGAFVQPPVTTEQILHPEKYPDDAPIQVGLEDLSATLGSGWSEIDAGVMGEWYTRLILTQGDNPAGRLDDATGREAAAGWGGDRYAVYEDDGGQHSALVLKSVWDTANDAGEFADAFAQYAGKLWGQGESAGEGVTRWQADGIMVLLLHTGEMTIWTQGPDAASAQALLDAAKKT